MALELFSNLPSTTVSSGGTSAPAGGTGETWTVASSTSFPAASNSGTSPTQFHVADIAANSEIIAVTNVSGTTWTVTRGAEGTTPVTHAAGFTIYQVTTAGGLGSFPQVFNVRSSLYGATGNGSTDDTTAINNAAAAANANGGGVVYFPKGNYVISSPVNVYQYLAYAGDGQDGTQITVASGSSTVSAFQSAASAVQQHITIRDLTIAYGGTAGTGSGNGIKIVSDVTLGSCPYLTFANLKIYGFGNCGMFLDGPIAANFTNVTSQNSGSDGFFMEQSRGGAFTSLSFSACYALSNGRHGYNFQQATYCSMQGCAADHNASDAYYLYNCQGVALNGCGCEYNSSGETATANGFVFDGGSNCCNLNACWVYQGQGSGKSFWVTGSSTFIVMTACRPNTPLGGNQAFQIDLGSAVTFVGCSAGGGSLTLNGTYTMVGTNFGGQEQVIGLPKTTAPSVVGTTTGQIYCDTSGNLYFLSSGGTSTKLAAV